MSPDTQGFVSRAGVRFWGRVMVMVKVRVGMRYRVRVVVIFGVGSGFSG